MQALPFLLLAIFAPLLSGVVGLLLPRRLLLPEYLFPWPAGDSSDLLVDAHGPVRG
ncbi:MAG: hypothetical protein HC898_03245 [Phycisphaerales bacterium]|nr:hypothetical protein [Phycisphaerales bacterium]